MRCARVPNTRSHHQSNMQRNLRVLLLLTVAVCVFGNLKILGGPAEEHHPHKIKKGELPKEHSKFVKKVVKDGDEIDLNPGGSVESILVSGEDEVELKGLSPKAEMIKRENRIFLKENKEKKIKMKVKKSKKNRRADDTFVTILATGSSDVTLETGFEEMNFLVGATIELRSCAVSEAGEASLSMGAVTVSSGGSRVALVADIDGACVTASHIPTAPGEYVYEVEVQGTADGEEFERSGIVSASVEEPLGEVEEALMLSDPEDSDYATIRVSGSGSASAGVRRCVGSTKLAGFNAGGNSKEIAYAQHIVEVSVGSDGAWSADLKLNGKWISKTGFTKTSQFELRAFSLVLVDGYVEIAAAESTPVRVEEDKLELPAAPAEVDEEMRVGKRPQQDPAVRRSKPDGKKMLVHGYCSGNVWGPEQYRFSNSAIFKDYQKSRSHDAFAQRILDWGSGWAGGFSIIAHSQGGAAALHLYSYYWSGLDTVLNAAEKNGVRAPNGGSRLIQSVGTPYKGTALAGNLALIGDIFSIGCGSNNDLTYNGASSWLSGIPNWAKNEVHYWTTSVKDNWWSYDYCHIATDLVLSDPDDGTTEKWAGTLGQGKSRGHMTGWCHTSGMSNPSQTTDNNRNNNMNSNAMY